LVGAVAADPSAARSRLAAVRAWWRVRHPPPSLGQRLDALYVGAIVAAIFGALAYGTASAALAQVVTPSGLAVSGPSLALLAVLLVARWGAYHGPVVFSVADVALLLGAPLPRRGMAARPLATALAGGAAAGAVVAGMVVVGLAGDGRGIAPDDAAGLVVGLADLGVIGVAVAWAVERSARWERAVRRAGWLVVLAAAALAAASGAGQVGGEIALWSGPWGWALQPGAGADSGQWLLALAALTVLAAVAAAGAVRTRGDCPTERHARRAEARASAVASLASFDARTARRAFETVGARGAGRAGARLRRPRSAGLAVPWRDAVTALRTPGRVLESAVLATAGTVLSLVEGDRPLAVIAGALVVYLGAARMLWPLRSELDAPDRARILLRLRIGRVLLAHTLVPVLAVVSAAVLAAAGCVVAGALPEHGAVLALLAIAGAPVITLCAGMSARRGGRLPATVFATAMAADPSGGGGAILGWFALWPTVAATLGAAPLLLVAAAGPAAAVPAAAASAIAGGILAYLVAQDVDKG
jgi:hypothetical protein